MSVAVPTAGALASAARLMSPPGRRYLWFAALTVAVAVAAAAMALPGSPSIPVESATFWVLAAAVVVGELFPIQLPRRDDLEDISLATPFAVALLLVSGPAAAVVAYAGISVVHDLILRTAPLKTAFNAAQYALSLLAGAAVLVLLGAPAAPSTAYVDDHLPALLAAGVVIFAVNQILVGVGTALVTNGRVRDLVLGDLPFQVWTSGFSLTLAPLVAIVAEREPALVALFVCPLLAIRIGGRQAILNAHHALHDGLTELPNRTMLALRMQEAIDRGGRGDLAMAVAIIDLNGFKAVNDTLGHDQGDRLLGLVAQRLHHAAPPAATLARLGGDEFGVVVPDTDAYRGRDILAAMLGVLDKPFDLDGVAVQVDASVGVSAFPEHGGTVQDLLKRADVALYSAKTRRTPVEVYNPQDDHHSVDRLALAAQLARGIDRGELVVHFQPKYALLEGRRHGVEALVRWNHPQLGLIGPAGFVPLAEQSRLLRPLTLFVLDETLHQCRRWRDEGLDLRVAVNVSARTLLDRELPRDIGALLERWSVPSDALQIEITESRIVAEDPRAEEVLAELQELGVGLAIDDFGTGFSSLAQLQRLPVDEIKIDKSFVMNMTASADDAAIVRSTIELGRTLSIDVTAEGVETPEAYASLVSLGCDFAQGYHVGRPSPADACARDLRRFIRAGAEHERAHV
jgi:diguanylate cyclase (GGDEF)-like protein